MKTVALLIALVSAVAVAAAQTPRPTPPTRDPNTPGYVTAKELPDGSVPPPTADGNFIIGPTHNPAPEMTVQDGVPQGTIYNFTMSSADSKIYPGIARDPGTFGTPDPNDPANLSAEYGRSRADERVRFVTSGVFRLPAHFTLAPIFEYGSGQPWNDRLGYDFNGDGKNGDRPAGLAKFTQDGPKFASLNVRLAYRIPLSGRAGVDVIAEAFNLFNRTNYDVNSIINGEFLSGPTLANGALRILEQIAEVPKVMDVRAVTEVVGEAQHGPRQHCVHWPAPRNSG